MHRVLVGGLTIGALTTAAAIFAVTSLLSTLDYSESKKAFDPAVITLAAVNPIVAALVVLLSWRLADFSGGDAHGRWRRVAWAVGLGSAVASVIGLALYAGSGVMSSVDRARAHTHRPSLDPERVPPSTAAVISGWPRWASRFVCSCACHQVHARW